MHPLLQAAEFQLRLLLESYSDTARIPPLLHLSIHRNETRDENRFTARFADGRQLWFACDSVTLMMAPPQWRSRRELVRILAGLWDEMRSERREPPRMIAPPMDEALRDEFMRPGLVEYVEYGDRRPSRGRRPQPTYRGVPIWEMDRIPPPPDINVINELARQRDMTIEEAFFGGPALRQADMRGVMGRCDCPACNPITAKAVVSKSVALLREWLSPTQLAQYDEFEYFDVTGSAGKRYRIAYGTQNNIVEYDESGTKATAVLCFGPQGGSGSLCGDVMLAQKIMLENDEPGALKVANVSRIPPTPIFQLW
jgi:hypothetical protein